MQGVDQRLRSPFGVYSVEDADAALARVFGAGVRPLRLEEALFDAILAGWRAQQSARLLLPETTKRERETVVRRLPRARWSAGRGSGGREDVDEWLGELSARRRGAGGLDASRVCRRGLRGVLGVPGR